MRLLCTGTVRRLVALVAALGLAWVFAPSAVAGGPTSVLVTSPESGQTASYYHTDAEYEALTAQIHDGGTTTPADGQKKRPAEVDSAVGSRQITVTWLAHDVTPWRVDRIFPSDDTSTVWLYSSSDAPGMDDGVWHKAKQPAELLVLLKTMGLMGEKTGSGVGGMTFPLPWQSDGGAAVGGPPAPEQPLRTPARQSAASEAPGDSDGWWAIPALAAGLGLGLVLRPLAARLPRPPFGRGGGGPERGPRQRLIDS